MEEAANGVKEGVGDGGEGEERDEHGNEDGGEGDEQDDPEAGLVVEEGGPDGKHVEQAQERGERDDGNERDEGRRGAPSLQLHVHEDDGPELIE